MSTLRDTQRAFLEGIYGEEPLDTRAGIYRRNVFANLHDALAGAYPVVRRLVGDSFFREAADCFARAHPSRSGDLHRHGAEFATFLEGYAPARELAYLPDVARLEWAIARAYDAADARAFDFARLSALPEDERPNVRLRFQPAASLVVSRFPVLAIWEANRPERDGTPDRESDGDGVLVHREGLAVVTRRLDAAEAAFLRACARGATLREMAGDETLAPVLAAQLVAWTRRTVIDGFLA